MNDKIGKMINAVSKMRLDKTIPIQQAFGKMAKTVEAHRLAEDWTIKIISNTHLYSRVFDIYGDFFEKLADGIKVKLLEEEIFGELELDAIHDLSEGKVIEIVFQFLAAKREAIIAKYDQFYKSGKLLTEVIKQSDQELQETLFAYFGEGGKPLATYIQKTYIDAKPKSIACIIYTLAKLNVIDKEFLNRKTDLHRIVRSTFNNPGTRQALSKSINELNSASDKENIKLTKFEREFKSYL